MKIQTFILTPFQQNTRVVSCENGLELQAIGITHAHLDHCGGTAALAGAFPEAEIIVHKGDEELYYALPQQPLFMGIQPHQMAAMGFDYADPPRVTRNWQHGEIYEVGDLKFSVRHCPGHTPGHVVLAEETERVVFTGDCLFSGTVGRSDLPGGDHAQLIESIRANVLSLDDDFTVYCGHGLETTVGHERVTNPFLS
jgi:hydroxyacylglutathione hydrolase